MNSVVDLFNEETVKQLASPSDFLKGQEIVQTDGVSFTEFAPLRVSAFVSSPATQARNTWLEATPEGAKWHCSCTANKARFCKHLVATALQAEKKSPHIR